MAMGENNMIGWTCQWKLNSQYFTVSGEFRADPLTALEYCLCPPERCLAAGCRTNLTCNLI